MAISSVSPLGHALCGSSDFSLHLAISQVPDSSLLCSFFSSHPLRVLVNLFPDPLGPVLTRIQFFKPPGRLPFPSSALVENSLTTRLAMSFSGRESVNVCWGPIVSQLVSHLLSSVVTYAHGWLTLALHGMTLKSPRLNELARTQGWLQTVRDQNSVLSAFRAKSTSYLLFLSSVHHQPNSQNYATVTKNLPISKVVTVTNPHH